MWAAVFAFLIVYSGWPVLLSLGFGLLVLIQIVCFGKREIKPDPDHPYHGNLDGPGQVTPRLGNYKDPVLKPWAAAQMRESNEEVLRGDRSMPFSAQAR